MNNSLCVSMNRPWREWPCGECFFCPTRVKRRGCWWSGNVGKDGQSCHTHHHSAITTSTNNNKTNIKEVEEVGWDKGRWKKKTRWQHMGFSPIDQGLTSPTPLSFGIMPFSFQRWTAIAGCGLFLIDVRVYMMPYYNVPNSMIYHRQLSPLPKHTQPKSMVGIFPLAPHHD